MASSIKTMPASKLKQLGDKKGGTCTVMYTSSSDSEKLVLLEGFPKQVGVTFSKLFSNHFPAINKIRLADLTRPRSNEILIAGGQIDAHKTILNWMISCCTGQGLQEFPTFETKKFTKYYLIKEAAQILGVPFVVDLMNNRMSGIAAVQVHSEDIRSLYGMLGREHELVKEVVQKTAELMARGPKAMRAYNVYLTLAQELKEFGDDIAPVMSIAKVQHDDQHQKERSHNREVQHQVWNVQKRAAYTARTKARRHPSHKTHMRAPAPAVSEPSIPEATHTVRKTIRAERRGNGHVVLPLAELGVGTNHNFLEPVQFATSHLSNKNHTSSDESEQQQSAAAASTTESEAKAKNLKREVDVDSVADLSGDTTPVEDNSSAGGEKSSDEPADVPKVKDNAAVLETNKVAL